MQQPSASQAIELGIPSKTRWRLPNGFGSVDLSPRQDGLPSHVGKINYKKIPLRPGMEVCTFDATFSSPIEINYEYLIEQPYIWIAMNVCGKGRYSHGADINGEFYGDQAFCAILRDPMIDVTYATGRHRGADIVVTHDRLREMLQGRRLCRPVDDFLDGRLDPMVATFRPSGFQRSIAHQIVNHPYQGVMASLFLEAKVFEMLGETLTVMAEDSQSTETGCGHRYAMIARDIMMTNLANPPRIEDVAKQVGLSQRRLNEVFRQVFGASPLQCLVSWRLDLARELLVAGQLTAKQIAYQVGYAHVSNFSLAFTRRFGHSPTSITGSESDFGRETP